jgi:hypothetical protein
MLRVEVSAERILAANGGKAVVTLDTEAYTHWLLLAHTPLTLTISCVFESLRFNYQATLPSLPIPDRPLSFSFSSVEDIPNLSLDHPVTIKEWIERDRRDKEGTPAISRKHGNDMAIYFFYEYDIRDPLTKHLGRQR